MRLPRVSDGFRAPLRPWKHLRFARDDAANEPSPRLRASS